MKRLHGIAAARGYAIGPAFRYQGGTLRVEAATAADSQQQLARSAAAVEEAAGQMHALIQRARAELAASEVGIFEAQLLMLEDPELHSGIRSLILDQHLTAEYAVQQAAEHHAQALEGLQDAYFKARAADVRDVARRIVRNLLGVKSTDLGGLERPCIVLARDLAPSDTLTMDRSKVLGFCVVEGSAVSHTAILARSLGIPAVVGSDAEILRIPDGSQLVVDGSRGEVVIEPTASLIQEYAKRAEASAASARAAAARCREPAVTADGRKVEVVANIGSLADARAAIENGAEGVGLLRTEFLYLERTSLPDESEQCRVYRDILEVFGRLPVILRTVDIGGDKPIPYLGLTREANPFLGVRGLRLSLARPDLFNPQIRAALQAGTGHNLKVMFPMVSVLEEVLAARRLMETCRDELRGEGKPCAETIEIGIMVEVPSAAMLAEQIAPAVDFFSIGTNDLTQYTMASDRTNPGVTHLADGFSPAVLKLIDLVVQGAHRHGKWVGVCGELGGEPAAIPILLGLGLDEFSMNAQTIPLAKEVLRGLSVPACQAVARQALQLNTAAQVRDLIVQVFPQTSV